MPDSSVAITAGTGTPIDTRTVTGGDHRQVMVIGDPATDTAVAPVSATDGLKVDPANTLADEATFTTGSNKVVPIAGIYNSTPDTLATGKAGALQMTTSRGLHVSLRNEDGTPVSAATAANTDSITAKLATDALQNGLTAVTPKFAVIQASAVGNNTIIAAVTSKKLRVLAYNFIANGTVNAKFQSGAGGTDLTGLKYCVANSGICAPFNPVGWIETASGALLNLNLSAAIAVGGEIVYAEI